MKKSQIAIIDYGMGNLYSVKRACEQAGISPVVTCDKAAILNAAAAILPGVGAFGNAMQNLKKNDLIIPIKEFIESGKPFMGICLGMQLLMSASEEFGYHEGLDVIKGMVVEFPSAGDNNKKIKVPQVGWNRITAPTESSRGLWPKTPLKNIKDGAFMYFVHSFYTKPFDAQKVLSISNYEGIEYCSSILWKNVFACQFHPERSAHDGLKIYKNFLSITNIY